MRAASITMLPLLACLMLIPCVALAQQPDAGANKDAGINADAAVDKDAAGGKDTPDSPWDEETRKKGREATGLLQQKKYEEAEKLFVEILDKTPDFEEVLLNYAVLLERTKRPDKALELLEAYRKRKPDAAQAYFFISGIQQRQKKDALALSIMEEAATKFPDNTEVHLRLARLNKNDDSKVIAEYKRALELDPKSNVALNNLGALYLRLNRYSEAAAILEEYVKAYPRAANGRFNLAMAYLSLGRSEEAIKIYQELSVNRPKDPFAVGGLCLAHVLAGQFDKADEVLKPFGAPDALSGAFAYCAGLRRLFAGNAAEATPLLRKATADGGQTFFIIALIESLRQQKQLDEAESLLAEHVKQHSSASNLTLPYQALLKLDRGKRDEARVLLEQAIAVQPDYKNTANFAHLVRMPAKGVEALQALSAPPPAPPEAKSGCGCRTTEGSPSNAALLAFALLGLGMLRRGRRGV